MQPDEAGAQICVQTPTVGSSPIDPGSHSSSPYARRIPKQNIGTLRALGSPSFSQKHTQSLTSSLGAVLLLHRFRLKNLSSSHKLRSTLPEMLAWEWSCAVLSVSLPTEITHLDKGVNTPFAACRPSILRPCQAWHLEAGASKEPRSGCSRTHNHEPWLLKARVLTPLKPYTEQASKHQLKELPKQRVTGTPGFEPWSTETLTWPRMVNIVWLSKNRNPRTKTI